MNTTRFDDVRVVILGQDPYHGAGQAHGLSFSVRSGVKLPPSLMNIYKEISAEYDVLMPKDGDLTRWAKQGVLLLNATLTVQDSLAGSHQNKGGKSLPMRLFAPSMIGQRILYFCCGVLCPEEGRDYWS